MLIAEKQLRNIIKKILNESSLGSSGSSGSSDSSDSADNAPQQERTWTDSTNSAYKYSYNPTTGVVKIVSSPKSKEQVIVDKTKKPKAYDAILAQFNKLPPAAATPPQPVTSTSEGNAGFVIFGKQDYFPLDAAARGDKETSKPGWVSKLIDQGHGFAIVVKGNGTAVRYDFGRYDEAKACIDQRLSAKLLARLGIGEMGIATMGVVVIFHCRVNAKFSNDKKEILNLEKFLAGTTKPNDSKSEYVIVPVADADAASAYALSKAGKCIPYAIPGFAALQSGTENCGMFAYHVIQAGNPIDPFNAEGWSLLDTPVNLYQGLAGSGVYKTA